MTTATTAGRTDTATRTTTGTDRRSLVLPGIAATAAAAVAVTTVAAIAGSAGVALGAAGESIPLTGFVTVTTFFSLVGIVLAAALRRWASRPRRTFVRVTTTLTALSLVPPFLIHADAASVATLVALHLIAAAIVVPAVASRLR
jgi:Family of unknown function (DUF6069)